MISAVYLSFAFAISEILLAIVKSSKWGNARMREDSGSLIILWLVITIGFTGGFFLANPVSQFWSGFGFVFILFGLIIRWASILQLGKSFTVDVAITDNARLKTDGLYQKVRHPSYSGLLAIISGFAFTMNSIYSFLVLVLPVFLAIIYRISVEEKVLINAFGNSYIEYKNRTKRIIPGIF
jgi:protein-S-isoprenylcysteine O-methyltransferase Ste14